MRRLPLLLFAGALLARPAAAAAQTADDTLPARVVERMFDALARGDVGALSALYDSVYYFRDLMVPPPGHPDRPAARSPEERAREWRNAPTVFQSDTPARRHRKVLQRMVAGRFVVYHVAVLFDPPNQERSFEKLEVYEVRNGKIVAEYDGQAVTSGRPGTAGRR